MAAMRTCPRCNTENDVVRGNCQSCGGVMLGVGGPTGEAGFTSTASLEPNVVPLGDLSGLPPALRAKLAKAQNMTPERAALIAKMLEKGAIVEARGRGVGQVKWVLAFMLLFFVVPFGTILWRMAPQITGTVPALAKPNVQPPPPPTAPDLTADLQADPVRLDGALIEGEKDVAGGVAGQELSRAQLHALHLCFRGNGYPTERPMGFGIQIAPQGEKPAITVLAMTDVQLPPGVVRCLEKRVPAQSWEPGLYFGQWPNDNNWP